MSAAATGPRDGGDGSRRLTRYVQIVVEVGSVLQAFPPPPGKTPTKVPYDPAQLIVTGGATVNANGVIALAAGKGQAVRVYAESGSSDFENAVLISSIDGKSDKPILEDFKLVKLPSKTVVPASGDEPLPVITVDKTFWFFESSVIGKGTVPYKLVLALYDRDRDTGQPHFAGLYQWNLKFRV